jgi:hypothetical protein
MIRFASASLASTVLLLAASWPGLNAGGWPPPNTPAAARPSPHVKVTASYLQALLDKANFIEFARQFPNAAGLKPEQELYFKGTLAYREGRFREAIDPLVAAVQTHNSSLAASQVESAFEILGQTAAKTFLYSSSAKMYDDIDRLY